MSDSSSKSLQEKSRQVPGSEPEAPAHTHPPVRSGPDGLIRVLLIDDNEAFREVASTCFTAAGYSVYRATDGFKALASVVQCRPDVVFVDTAMPKLDGYQICALIKSNSDYRHIPVIMVPGKGGLLDQARVQLVGGDAHVSKPFTAQALLAAVCEVRPSVKISNEQTQALPVIDEFPG